MNFKTIITAILLSLAAMSVDAQNVYALLLGVQNYDNPNFQQSKLVNTSKDVDELDNILNQAGAQTTKLTGKYANRENLEKYVDQLVQTVNQRAGKDNIIIYFSGHGVPGAICLWDNPYTYTDLFTKLKEAKVNGVYIFTDCCHSGSAGMVIKYMPQIVNKKMVFFSACKDSEQSKDGNNLITHGWFTQALTKGLRGLSDKDHNKRVTVAELYQYIYNDVLPRCDRYNETFPNEEPAVMHPQCFGPGSMLKHVVLIWK